MSSIGAQAAQKTLELLSLPTGLAYAVSTISEREMAELTPIEPAQIAALQVGFEIPEQSTGVSYPAVYVYCLEISNLLKEKFRTFSGKISMAVEVRISHDRLEAMAGVLELYTSAVTEVLDCHRGDWGSGMYYTGGYKAEFGPIKRGGRNFVRTARILFEVDASA